MFFIFSNWGDVLKERILEWSQKEIQRKGIRFTISDLTRQLGISSKTFYEYYPSKDKLIEELLNSAIEDLQKQEKDILSDTTLTVREKLEKCLVLLPTEFQFAQLHLLEEIQRYYPEEWKRLDQFIHEQWEGILLLIDEGVSNGIFLSFNTKVFIDLYIGGLYRLMEKSSENRNEMPLSNTLQEMVNILVHGILHKEEN